MSRIVDLSRFNVDYQLLEDEKGAFIGFRFFPLSDESPDLKLFNNSFSDAFFSAKENGADGNIAYVGDDVFEVYLREVTTEDFENWFPGFDRNDSSFVKDGEAPSVKKEGIPVFSVSSRGVARTYRGVSDAFTGKKMSDFTKPSFQATVLERTFGLDQGKEFIEFFAVQANFTPQEKAIFEGRVVPLLKKINNGDFKHKEFHFDHFGEHRIFPPVRLVHDDVIPLASPAVNYDEILRSINIEEELERRASTKKIIDEGEKIWGAKKDKVRKYLISLEEYSQKTYAAKLEYLDKSTLWAFSAQEEKVAGSDPRVVNAIAYIRSKIKPAYKKVEDRIEGAQVESEEMCEKYLLSIKTLAEFYDVSLSADELIEKISSLSKEEKKELTEAFKTVGVVSGLENFVSIRDLRESAISSRLNEDQKPVGFRPFMYGKLEERTTADLNKKSKQRVVTDEDYQVIPYDGELSEDQKNYAWSFVYQERGPSLRAEKEGLEPKKPILDQLVTSFKSDREVFADSEKFREKIGFKGVEFGESLPEMEKKTLLDMGYDAMYALAKTIGVNVNDLSLGNDMSLGFATRGHGHASAHYEPDKRVINLTRKNGNGSLCHEIFHAIDHSMSKMVMRSQGCLTENMLLSQFARAGNSTSTLTLNNGNGETKSHVIDFFKIAESNVASEPSRASYFRIQSEIENAIVLLRTGKQAELKHEFDPEYDIKKRMNVLNEEIETRYENSDKASSLEESKKLVYSKIIGSSIVPVIESQTASYIKDFVQSCRTKKAESMADYADDMIWRKGDELMKVRFISEEMAKKNKNLEADTARSYLDKKCKALMSSYKLKSAVHTIQSTSTDPRSKGVRGESKVNRELINAFESIAILMKNALVGAIHEKAITAEDIESISSASRSTFTDILSDHFNIDKEVVRTKIVSDLTWAKIKQDAVNMACYELHTELDDELTEDDKDQAFAVMKEGAISSSAQIISTRFYRSAIMLDRGARGKYWSKDLEMLARAFESITHDRLIEKSMQCDFLVHSVGSNLFSGGQFLGNPYPSGRERELIRNQLDKGNHALKGFLVYQNSKNDPEKLLERMADHFSVSNEFEDAKTSLGLIKENSKLEVLNGLKEFTEKAKKRIPSNP